MTTVRRTVVRVRPAPGTVPPPRPPTPASEPPSEPHRPVLAGLVVLVVLIGVLLLQVAMRTAGDETRTVDQAPIETTASDAVLTVLQLAGGASLNATSLTPALAERLTAGESSFIASMQQSGYSPRGGPVEVGVVEQTQDEAVAIVAAAGDIRDAGGRSVGDHQLTFELHLVRAGDRWLVDGIEVLL